MIDEQKEQKWNEEWRTDGFECIKSLIIISHTYIQHRVGH